MKFRVSENRVPPKSRGWSSYSQSKLQFWGYPLTKPVAWSRSWGLHPTDQHRRNASAAWWFSAAEGSCRRPQRSSEYSAKTIQKGASPIISPLHFGFMWIIWGSLGVLRHWRYCCKLWTCFVDPRLQLHQLHQLQVWGALREAKMTWAQWRWNQFDMPRLKVEQCIVVLLGNRFYRCLHNVTIVRHLDSQENLPSHGGIAEETTGIHRVGMPWNRVLPAVEPFPAAVEQKLRQDLPGWSHRSGSRSKGGRSNQWQPCSRHPPNSRIQYYTIWLCSNIWPSIYGNMAICSLAMLQDMTSPQFSESFFFWEKPNRKPWTFYGHFTTIDHT